MNVFAKTTPAEHDQREKLVRAALDAAPRAEALSVGRLARLTCDRYGWAGMREWLRSAAAAARMKDHILGTDARGRPAVYYTRKIALGGE